MKEPKIRLGVTANAGLREKIGKVRRILGGINTDGLELGLDLIPDNPSFMATVADNRLEGIRTIKNFRVSVELDRRLKEMANQWTDGNVSLLIEAAFVLAERKLKGKTLEHKRENPVLQNIQDEDLIQSLRLRGYDVSSLQKPPES